MVRIIAHRGLPWRYPENTVISFEKAVEAGVDEIELDVKLTRDKEPVVLHDLAVDRTTDGHGKINELTLKEVKKLSAGNREDLPGVRIPTFEEAVNVIPDNVEMNLHTWTDPLLVEKIVKTLMEKKKMKNSYLAIASSMIPVARSIYPEMRICNMEFQKLPEEYMDEAIKWNCERVQFFSPSYRITREMVQRVHCAGMVANVFVANTVENADYYAGIGVDAILTDCADVLLQWRGKFRRISP